MGGFLISMQTYMADKKELTREQKIALEEKAVQALLDMGVKFSVPLDMDIKEQPRWVSWWNKHFPKHPYHWRDKRIPKDWDVSLDEIPSTDHQGMEKVYQRHFYIKPLYLGTIDTIRALYLNIEFDEGKVKEAPAAENRRLFKYIPLMAQIASVAVINNPSITDLTAPSVERLKDFFIHHLTVNFLKRLCDIIATAMNTVGFTNSIISITEISTTKPKSDMIE